MLTGDERDGREKESTEKALRKFGESEEGLVGDGCGEPSLDFRGR